MTKNERSPFEDATRGRRGLEWYERCGYDSWEEEAGGTGAIIGRPLGNWAFMARSHQ
jgi:hypothetical protein